MAGGIFQILFVGVHALVFWRVGLPIVTVSIGVGPAWIDTEVRGTTIKLRALPISSYVRTVEGAIEALPFWRRAHLFVVPTAILYGALWIMLGTLPFVRRLIDSIIALEALARPWSAAHTALGEALLHRLATDPGDGVIRCLMGLTGLTALLQVTAGQMPDRGRWLILSSAFSLYLTVCVLLLLF